MLCGIAGVAVVDKQLATTAEERLSHPQLTEDSIDSERLSSRRLNHHNDAEAPDPKSHAVRDNGSIFFRYLTSLH